MTPCPNIPFAAVGILALKFITVPLDDPYDLGRQARIDNQAFCTNPYYVGSHDCTAWARGWEVVDYALNHPENSNP